MLDGTVEGVLQGFATDVNGNQILIRADIAMAPGTGHNLFSAMAAAKKRTVTISDNRNLRLEGFNATVPLWSENDGLYHSFVLDLRADRYGPK